MRKAKPLADRFWEKVPDQPGDDCWEWAAARNRRGYGVINVGKRGDGNVLASRLAFQLCRADPGGFFVCHACDNPPCVNPNHLFLGSHVDNMRDAVRKNRMYRPNVGVTHCKRGHLFDDQNTRWRGRTRQCKACMAIYKRAHRERRAAA